MACATRSAEDSVVIVARTGEKEIFGKSSRIQWVDGLLSFLYFDGGETLVRALGAFLF